MKRQLFILFGLLLAAAAFGDADIEVTPAEHDFGVVEMGVSASAVIELKNVGDRVLRLDDIALADETDGDYKITSMVYLPVFYGPGGSFCVEVSYSPTKPGKSQAKLKIASSDPDESEVDIPLNGEAPSDEMSPEEQIAALIEFFDQAVEKGELEGVLPKGLRKKQFERFWTRFRLRAFRHKLLGAQKSIENEWFRWTRELLQSAFKKADGKQRPPDWVQGPAVSELGERIDQLLQTLTEQ